MRQNLVLGQTPWIISRFVILTLNNLFHVSVEREGIFIKLRYKRLFLSHLKECVDVVKKNLDCFFTEEQRDLAKRLVGKLTPKNALRN